MIREYHARAYTLRRHDDRTWEFVEPVTGLRASHARFGDAMAAMHRQLIDRRDQLLARDPAALSEVEHAELAHLGGYADSFLRQGLTAGSSAT